MDEVYFGELLKFRLKNNGSNPILMTCWTFNNNSYVTSVNDPNDFKQQFGVAAPFQYLSADSVFNNSGLMSYSTVDFPSNNIVHVTGKALQNTSTDLTYSTSVFVGNQDFQGKAFAKGHISFLVPTNVVRFEITFKYYFQYNFEEYLRYLRITDFPTSSNRYARMSGVASVYDSTTDTLVITGNMATTGILRLYAIISDIDYILTYDCTALFYDSNENLVETTSNDILNFSDSIDYSHDIHFNDLHSFYVIGDSTYEHGPTDGIYIYQTNYLRSGKEEIVPVKYEFRDLIKLKPVNYQYITEVSGLPVQYHTQIDENNPIPFIYDEVYDELWLEGYQMSKGISKGLIKFKSLEDETIFHKDELYVTKPQKKEADIYFFQKLYIPLSDFTTFDPLTESFKEVPRTYVIKSSDYTDYKFLVFILTRYFLYNRLYDELKVNIIELTGVIDE